MIRKLIQNSSFWDTNYFHYGYNNYDEKFLKNKIRDCRHLSFLSSQLYKNITHT